MYVQIIDIISSFAPRVAHDDRRNNTVHESESEYGSMPVSP